MATNTPNLNLVKPELNDFADIRVLNGNMDIIDTQLKKAWTRIDLSNYVTKPELNNYLPLTGGNLSGDITIKNNDIDYVIEHITSGRSHYDKYKSGKLVQVIYKDRTDSGVTGINVDTLTFLTPFIDEKYLAWVSGSNGTNEPRWGGRTTTSMSVTVDTETDVYAIIVGRWKE